jgi:hypothetical protein
MRPPRPRLASWIYGTVLATSLVAGFSEDPENTELEIAITVLVTSLVFWLAHVHAELFAERYVAGRPLERAEMRARLRGEWPMVHGSFPAVAILLLGTIGVLSRDSAETLAIVAGVAALIALGIAIGLKEHLSTLKLIGVTLLNAFYGVVIVILKVLVH